MIGADHHQGAAGEAVSDPEGELPKRCRVEVPGPRHHQGAVTDADRLCGELGGELAPALGSDGVQFVLQPVDPLQKGLDPGGDIGARDLEETPRSVEAGAELGQLLIGGETGETLDPAQVGADRGLRRDQERAHLCRGMGVGAAAEFGGVVADLDHADGFAVLVPEERQRPHLLRVLLAGHGGGHRVVVDEPAVDLGLDLRQLLGGDLGEVREVEPKPARLDQGAGLGGVVTEDIPQRPMQDMSAGVAPPYRLPTRGVDGRLGLLPDRHVA